MRYAIISDIHSNLEALNSILEFLQSNPVDKLICCGDIVGYGPNPRECINRLNEFKNFISVLGNHDAAIIGKIDINLFNKEAREAIDINKKLLTDKEINYLSSLKIKFSENNILFVHGSPRDPINEYLFLAEKFIQMTSYFKEKVCFVGHTHQPIIFEIDEKGNANFYQNIDLFNLEEDKRYIINVGSVGQPRDNNPNSCIVFYDTKYSLITFKRIEYDVTKTQKKMLELNLPKKLIERLIYGI